MIKTILMPLKLVGQYAIYQSIALPLALLMLAIMLIISPVGEFPLNDDWIYTKTVQHLLQTGQYHAHPYLNATLIVQSYWGALFCKLFGFSFTTLRFSTLLLGILNAWGVARCGLALGLSRSWALLCGIIIMTNPIVLGLSYSFMTDVPFLTLSTLSGLCFLKALRKLSPGLVFWGSLLGVAAFFVRQFGVLVPVAFALTLAILRFRQHLYPQIAIWLALGMPWVAASMAYFGFARVIQSDTPILESFENRLWVACMDGLRFLPISLSYIGLFLLPLGIVRGWQLWKGHERWCRRQWLVYGGFCSLSLMLFILPNILYTLHPMGSHQRSIWLHQYPDRMPLLPFGMLLDFGLGHAQLPNPIPQPAVQIRSWWWAVTLPALGIGSLLFTRALEQIRLLFNSPYLKHQGFSTAQSQALFLWTWSGISLLALFNPWRIYITDRYLLIAFVPFLLLMASEIRQFFHRGALRWVMMCTGGILAIGLMLLQDYMAWNRAASMAQHRLMSHYHVPAAAIAGIDQLNGWYNADAYIKLHNTRSWWDLNIGDKGAWVIDDRYVIASVEPRSGYEVLEHIPYFSWIGWREREIVTFRRLER
jgi:Dolichyl-phosphate-mannose-protein mannosyltransferase